MPTSQAKEHVLISGASGLIGSAVTATLSAEGHRLTRLVRHNAGPGSSAQSVTWDQKEDSVLRTFLSGSPVDVVIHLAGAPIFAPWTVAYKKEIHDSRVVGTQHLAATLAAADQKPKLMICASAIGFYGHRGSEILTEESPPGTGFLAHTCAEWEAAAEPAHAAGIRVVNLRLGVVLARHGGALKTMLPSFKLGLGARLGSGNQWMSWIALADLVEVIRFAMAHGEILGAINAVSPNSVTNRDFTKTLAKVLKRFAFLSVPEFVLRMAPGGMGDEALLASARVVPKELTRKGFNFKFPELEQSLRATLHKDA